MTDGKPKVWFERPILTSLGDEIRRIFEPLGPASSTPADPLSALAEAEGVVASTFTYDSRLFDRAPKLRVIARTGIGVDTVDVVEATRRGIVVCNTPDGPTTSTAEHAVMLILMAAKRVKQAEGALRSGGQDMFASHSGMELSGKNLGLVGYGRIARSVGRIAEAMGMRVRAFDPNLPPEVFGNVERAHDLSSLLRDSDVVSVHVPLTPETRGMFGKVEFESMRPNAVFVNTARGGLVDLEALAASLDDGRLGAAGLDVTDPEPLPPHHPLLHRPDVVITPHVASATQEAKERIFRTAVGQVADVLHRRRPAHPVNPEVLKGLDLEPR